ncbi:unnamed protein product [Auanema sp. JU1783]|nr:unnamed protein product [Auanema sp. JU1783]
MEVASTAATILHSKSSKNGWKENVIRKQHPVPSIETQYIMDHRTHGSEGDSNEIPTLTCPDPDMIIHDDEKDRLSSVSNLSHSRSLTPPPILEAMYDGQHPSSSGESQRAERRSLRRSAHNISHNGNIEGERRNRVTRNRDDPTEMVNNYVDSSDLKEPRQVNPPRGSQRIPFVLPKSDIEKEKDRLKIHMVGPNKREVKEPDENRSRPKRRYSEILVGDSYQATVNLYSPIDWSRAPEEDADRDVLIWKDSTTLNGVDRELDDAWCVIRRQFKGKIPLDSVLYRLMKCDYNIEEMLRTIELEQFENLPQPFEDFNTIQQREFERHLRKQGNPLGKHREGEKIFRLFQEKFLKTYYLGEILAYYYETKKKGCFHELYNRCLCREKLLEDAKCVHRFECSNCTKYIWGDVKRVPESFCDLCMHFFSRYRYHREPAAQLIEPEYKIAQKWFDLEKETKRHYSIYEVQQIIEEERMASITQFPNADEIPNQFLKGRHVKLPKEQLCSFTKKFETKTDEKCSLLRPWGKCLTKFSLKQYTPDEAFSFVKAFNKFGNKPDQVAQELRVSLVEATTFYKRFSAKFHLEKPNTDHSKSGKKHAEPRHSPEERDVSYSPSPAPSTRHASKTPLSSSTTNYSSNFTGIREGFNPRKDKRDNSVSKSPGNQRSSNSENLGKSTSVD